MNKIYIPGVAQYGQLKSQFLDAEQMLGDPKTNANSLSRIVRGFNENQDTTRFLQAEFGEQYVALCSSVNAMYKDNFHLDTTAADDGAKRTQSDWFDYWDNIDDGRVMASAGDLYRSFKQLKDMYENGQQQEKSFAKKIRLGLQKDFEDGRVITSSTRIEKLNDSKVTISHHYGSTSGLFKEYTHTDYNLGTVPIEKLYDQNGGFNLIQKVLDTTDSKDTIEDTLKFIGNPITEIFVKLDASRKVGEKIMPCAPISFRYYDSTFMIINMRDTSIFTSRGIRI